MGGNIFKDQARPIVRENVRPTLKKYIEALGYAFPKKAHVFENFHTVGSTGKKEVSGDMDLAIDFKHFFDDEPYNDKELREYLIDPQEWRKLYEKTKSRARTATDNMCKLKAFLKLISAPIASTGLIQVANKKTTTGNIFTLFSQYDYYGERNHGVQIDWMIGDLPWLKFAYHSSETGQMKGLHRTQLIVAMLSAKGYTFSHTTGIKDKDSNSFVATTPKEARDLLTKLYGSITPEDLENYKNLHSYLEYNSSPEDYKSAIQCYIRILTVSKARIPMNIRGLIDENP